MLALSIDEFDVEFKDGSVKNVGAPNKRATAKLFDVTEATARQYGDDRVKLVFEDDEGNEVQAALFADEAPALASELAALAPEDDASD
jgi:hypothetical protein